MGPVRKVKLSILLAIIAVTFTANASGDPITTVDQTVGRLLQALQTSNEGQKVRQLCSIVNRDVDTQAIGFEILGRQFAKSGDESGIRLFMALVPSIIVSEFYNTLVKVKTFEYTIETALLPQGSSKVGVKSIISGVPVVITLDKARLLIQDVSWNGLSLIQSRKTPIQAQLAAQKALGATSPVGSTAKSLVQSGDLIRCP